MMETAADMQGQIGARDQPQPHEPGGHAAEPHGQLERGRACFARREWGAAFDSLVQADRAAQLNADDLERLAVSAYLTGHDEDYLACLDRAHRALAGGEPRRAARHAFWIGLFLLLRGDMGRADGWLARAQRLVEGDAPDSVEHGYLLVAIAQRHVCSGEWQLARAAAEQAVAIGERDADSELAAVARHVKGRILMRQWHVQEGIVLLDEAMVAATSGELSPIMTGLIYCSVIDACQEVFAYGRSCEWTVAYQSWCDRQPELIAFTGICLAHRSEVLLLQGDWDNAMIEAQRAVERALKAGSARTASAAWYQQGEIHRLRGQSGPAEHAYREASQRGFEPQPGLALLWLSQGRPEAAAAVLRRLLATTAEDLQRTRYLPAWIETLITLGDAAEARSASSELDTIAAKYRGGTPGALEALAARARGSVELAEGKPEAALVSLRQAWALWQQIAAPYEAARTRVAIALACRALHDEESCRLELESARATFGGLGALPDVSRADVLGQPGSGDVPCPLTPRELQVLRLVAAGKTNKAIAAELCLSERTVDRHLSKIFNKLDVPSRTAAAAYAFNHKLVCAN